MYGKVNTIKKNASVGATTLSTTTFCITTLSFTIKNMLSTTTLFITTLSIAIKKLIVSKMVIVMLSVAFYC